MSDIDNARSRTLTHVMYDSMLMLLFIELMSSPHSVVAVKLDLLLQ